MSLSPQPPQRPMLWPPLVEQLAAACGSPDQVYLVGGAVRDALRGREVHDFDLSTPLSGREIARRIANRLDGKYYALDADRDVGRAILPVDDLLVVVDVASFRGDTLQSDLEGRDFTINAMVVCLSDLESIIDPLDGQNDLFASKRLRQCSPTSIADDPLRALRAVRHSVQFGLRMEPALVAAARIAAGALFGADGLPAQPERTRDELFKLIALNDAPSALRVLNRLGLLSLTGLVGQVDAAALEYRLAVVEALAGVLHIVSPRRDDNTASSLILGTAVMVLDRFREKLQNHFAAPFAEDRQRAGLLIAASLSAPGTVDWRRWAALYSLSNPEKKLLADLDLARRKLPAVSDPTDRRAVYRYFKGVGDLGVDAIFVALAEYLASNTPTPNAVEWGDILDTIASPLLDAFFNHHAEQIAPSPLLSGDDLQQQLGLEPGQILGKLIGQLVEAQAAGEIETQKEALQFVKRLLNSG